MDRINTKLEEGLTGVQMGNKKLEQAKKSLENGLAAKIIKFLLISNFIIFLLSLLRFI
jgi:t-SNARE complex subunit (syntaxin)